LILDLNEPVTWDWLPRSRHATQDQARGNESAEPYMAEAAWRLPRSSIWFEKAPAIGYLPVFANFLRRG